MGLTQHEMAERIEVPYRTLGDNERGLSIPGGRVLAAYSGLGVSVDFILTGEGKPFRSDGDNEALSLAEHEGNVRIPIATFEPVDDLESYIVDGTERRLRSKLSVSHQVARAMMAGANLGPPEAMRLASFLDVAKNRMVMFDASVESVNEDAEYLVKIDELIEVHRVQPVSTDTLAVMNIHDPSRVERIVEGGALSVRGRVVAALSPFPSA